MWTRLGWAMLACCGYESAGRTITPADIGDADRTRVTAFLSGPSRPGSPSETVPGALPKSALADEASLVQARSDEVCFTLTTRTLAELDAPLAVLPITLDTVAAKLKSERVTVREYGPSGVPTTLVEDAEEPIGLGAPSKDSVRVFERSASGCAKVAGLPEPIVLEVRVPQPDGKGDWGERFVWSFKR